MALLLMLGDLGCFDPQWRGWQVRGGKLISRAGWEIAVNDVLAVPVMRQQIAAYHAELRGIRERLLLMQEQPAPEAWPEWVFEQLA